MNRDCDDKSDNNSISFQAIPSTQSNCGIAVIILHLLYIYDRKCHEANVGYANTGG